MRFLRDRRGQRVWIGALLLLMVVLLAFTIYQSTVVPQQTERVEFQHARAVQSDMARLDARIGLLGATGGTQSVTVDLAPEYPMRLFALNPPVPAGTLRTRTRGPVRLSVGGDPVNLSRVCGYGERVTTATLAYSIDYQRYVREPTMASEQSVQYRHTSTGYHLFGGGQSLVLNDSITLVPLAGDYSETGTGTASVRLVAGPLNTTTVTAPANDPVRLSLPSTLPASSKLVRTA